MRIELLGNVAGPCQSGNLDDERSIGRLEPGADAPSKPKRRETFEIGILLQRLFVRGPVGGEVPTGIKVFAVRIQRSFSIDCPLIAVYEGAFGDKVSLVFIVFGQSVGEI